MTLAEFTASKKKEIYNDLRQARKPDGRHDEAALASLLGRSEPQMGATVLEPDKVRFEFIFPQGDGSVELFKIELSPPERIVFMPVPGWVVETIWQGEVAGSHHFESDAKQLLKKLADSLEPLANKKLFDRPQPARRE